MGIKEFAEAIIEKLAGKIEGVTEVSMKQVTKNNSVVLHGLVFHEESSNVSPSIYIEGYYQRYRQGESIDSLAQCIIACYEENRIEGDMDVSFLRDWEQVKSKVAYRLINGKKNKELLSRMPHKEWLDLALVYFIPVEQCGGFISIHKEHMHMWGIDLETLDQAARENTPKLFPAKCQSLWEMMKDKLPDDLAETDVEMPVLYVLNNHKGVYGAATLLYPDSMEMVSEQLGADVAEFYILPSSLHEVLVLPGKEGKPIEVLKAMVEEVNATVVEAEEVLSDSVYRYCANTGEIVLAA